MMLEEMELDGVDAREVELDVDEAARAAFPVVVIGCGQSGLLAGIRLKEAGIPFTIVEKNAGVGGTWYENTYPGCRVDVGNHFYCYSFEPSDHWSEFFAQQPELQRYFADVLQRHGIEPARAVGDRSGRAREWDDDAGDVARARACAPTAPRRRSSRARVISAVGQLNRPQAPRHPRPRRLRRPVVPLGRAGITPSTSRGKRVALIGAGASGFQIAPAIADEVAAPHRVPTHRAVDVPEPELPRAGRARRAVGAPPSAVLRTVVPVPVVLARLRRRARRRARRSRMAAPGTRGERDERPHAPDVHGLDHEPGRQRPRPRREGRSRLPGHGQAHAAGQRQLAADPDARRRRARPRGHRPHRSRRGGRRPRARVTRSTSSSSRPGSRPTGSCGRWTIVGRDGAVLAERWGDGPPRISASRFPSSRTCSACTGRARTSRTAAA